MKNNNIFIALLLLISTSFVIQAASVEDFSRHPQYLDIKISPDGKHIAALVNREGVNALVFFETKTLKITNVYKIYINPANKHTSKRRLLYVLSRRLRRL